MKEIKNLYEKILIILEDFLDRREIEKAIKNGELEKGEDYEKVAKELGI